VKRREKSLKMGRAQQGQLPSFSLFGLLGPTLLRWPGQGRPWDSAHHGLAEIKAPNDHALYGQAVLSGGGLGLLESW
jgi:hypothetical protein